MGAIISLGEWIKRRRKALDLTQDALAQRVGCSLETIRKIEADARRPSREIAARLADALELAADERAPFVQAARAELSADRLTPPAHSVARAAFVPAQAVSSAADTPGEHPPARPTNLPTPPTALIGRESEIAQIGALLRRADVRLVTLTGPGGIGKTRLGLQVAAELVEQFPDGVYFVDLAPVRDPTLVSGAIAQTLGVREIGGQPLLATLKGYLHNRRLLLMLDNFEHLLDAAPLVAELLESAAQLNVLATSRELLHLRGEQEEAVPPLALPDPTQLPALDQLRQYAAVALFSERVQARQPGFQVTSANATAVAEICVRLDGLPLAIELVAARLKLFAPEVLHVRLSSRLALLTGGARDLPMRQQTIRKTIAWSYDLLTESEQALFRRLGVFVGGCTLEAAEFMNDEQRMMNDEIAEPSGSASSFIVHPSSFELLAALVDKSLLLSVEGSDSSVRFSMLETIREYALERLEASGEAEQLRQRHAAYYMTLGEVVFPDVWRPEKTAHLVPEYDNLWSALSWSQTAAGDPETALPISDALRILWFRRGTPREAIVALERTLNHPLGVGRTIAHTAARFALGQFLGYVSDYAAARIQYEQVLELAREVGNKWWYAVALASLGHLAREQGDSATAWARLTESLAINRELGDITRVAEGLNTLAEVAILEEDPARAEALLTESRALAQGENLNTVGWTLNHLGHAAQLRGAYDRAAQLHLESIECFQAFSEQQYGLHSAYQSLGETALGQGHLDEATRWLTQGLALSQTLSDQASVSWCLAGLGGAAALDEEPERAARLWGAAERLRQAIGSRPAPAARKTYERAIVAARVQLGEEAFATAWEAGGALTLEQAIAEALAPI